MDKGAVTKSDHKIIYAKYSGRCAYCGCRKPLSEMQVYFESEETNPACSTCNYYLKTIGVTKFKDVIGKSRDMLIQTNNMYRIAEKYGQVKPIRQPVTFYYEGQKGENYDL